MDNGVWLGVPLLLVLPVILFAHHYAGKKTERNISPFVGNLAPGFVLSDLVIDGPIPNKLVTFLVINSTLIYTILHNLLILYKKNSEK